MIPPQLSFGQPGLIACCWGGYCDNRAKELTDTKIAKCSAKQRMRFYSPDWQAPNYYPNR